MRRRGETNGPGGTLDLTAEMAAWVAGLRFDEIPARVVERAKLQVLSVLGAVFAGATTEESARIVEVVKRWGGPAEATCLPGGARMPASHAAYAMAALSMALDYDDYLFPCHTGHSAVLASLALSESAGLTGKEWLTAQVVANETEGRLAASVLLGPFNGQMCSFVHLLGSAIVAAKLKGLGPTPTADAIRIALYQTNHGLYGGFMGTGAKALTASGAIWSGIAAAEMAEAGMRGMGDILSGEHGFVREFSFLPLPKMLSGYGRTWLSDTLCYKIYPGCAYIDSAVDCAVKIAEEKGFRPVEVAEVIVRASLLTIKMEALAAPFLRGPDTLPQTLNFTIPYNVATTLFDGDLRPSHFRPSAIRDPKVWDLASRVRLVHDPARTLALRRSSEPFLDPRWLASMRAGDLFDFVGHHLAPAELLSVLGSLAAPAALFRIAGETRRRLKTRPVSGDPAGRNGGLGELDLSGYRMEFGASVEVRMRGGKRLEASQDVPFGAAGRPLEETREKVREKFLREASPAIGEGAAQASVDLVMRLERAGAAEVRALVRGLIRPDRGAHLRRRRKP